MSRILGLATGVAFGSFALTSSPGQPPQPPSIVVNNLPGVQGCFHDRVLAAPDGQAFSAWTDFGRAILLNRSMTPPALLLVGDWSTAVGATLNLRAVDGRGQRLTPLRWGSSGEGLYIRVREARARLVRLGSARSIVEEVAPLPVAWARVDINATSHGGIDPLLNPTVLAAAGAIDGSLLLRGIATLQKDGIELVAVRRNDLALVRPSAAGLIETGVNAAETRSLKLFSNATYFASGISYLGSPSRMMNPDYVPYQLPLEDLETGEVAGHFNVETVVLPASHSLREALKKVNAQIAHRGELILDASLSGQTLITLTRSASGERRIYRARRGGATDHLICAATAQAAGPSAGRTGGSAPIPRPDVAMLDYEGRETTDRGGPLVARYSTGAPGQRDVVIYFHGGPGSSIIDNPFPQPVTRLLSAKRDVIAVEYAGSLGGGPELARRLQGGVDALRADVRSVAAWVRSKNYRSVAVIGSSFGGTVALVARTFQFDPSYRVFYIAPLLRLQGTEGWAKVGSGLAPVMADTQLAYEHFFFGGTTGRAMFAEELGHMVAKLRSTSSDAFYFGELDQQSRSEHLPTLGQAARLVLARRVHAGMNAEEEVWDDVLARLLSHTSHLR